MEAKTIVTLDHTAVREIMRQDPEFMLQVRDSVLKSACKNTVNKIVTKDFNDTVQAFVQANVKEQLGVLKGYGRNQDFIPSATFCRLFFDKLKKDINHEIEGFVEDQTKKATDEIKQEISQITKERLNHLQRVFIEKEIKNTLERIAREILREG